MDNKEVARRFLEVFSKGDAHVLTEVLAHDVVDHTPLPGVRPGRDGFADSVAMFRAGFPDLQVTIDRLVADSDYVAATGIASGSNTGSILGAPPTGKHVSFPYLDMYRIQDGRIFECWHVEDIAGMLMQLGLFPQS